MSADSRMRVIIGWHMHQPEYRDLSSGTYMLPWTYLHAIKDYVDMAAHLEAVPGARAVVNFAPILLDQIHDLAGQVRDWQTAGTPVRDLLLSALVSDGPPETAEDLEALLRACRRANDTRMIRRFPAFERLVQLTDWLLENQGLAYANAQFVADLVTWYHLAWLGETVRLDNPLVERLQDQAQGFTMADRRALLELIGSLLAGIIPRYRSLARNGRIELAFSPDTHPILPLLLDLSSAREAIHDVTLPARSSYPGGAERARQQVVAGMAAFERHFGLRPAGCWPSEGAVSDATLALLADNGLLWAASGESVLRNSLARSEHYGEGVQQHLHRPYATADRRLALFARDDGLSDLIGFTYASWHADDAVSNLIHHLVDLSEETTTDDERVVVLFLDGENAWEHYPNNGAYFLRALYERLSEHPSLQLTTFSEVLRDGPPTRILDHVVAGSWVYGTLSTWIGDQDKNRGWELLCDAKRAYDEALRRDTLEPSARTAAERQLSACEGSDWFWWFGDYNPEDTVSDFERLFRHHLLMLYRRIGQPPPTDLHQVMSRGTGEPAHGGTMRRSSPA
jgi:alpha-amylase/alpha-mannosidase (GH57 family)